MSDPTPMQPEEDLASIRMREPERVAEGIIYASSQPAHVCVNDLRVIPVPRPDDAD